MKHQHQIKITVTPADIDEQGHVNNVVYVRWVQEVAASHWQNVATVEDQHKFRWVVFRHEIDYLKPALPGDELLAITWVEALQGVKSIRIVELKRGETILVKARPSRVSDDIAKAFL